MRGQPGFFDVDERLQRLSRRGDHLEAFAAAAVNFEMFPADLVAALDYSGGSQGRPPPFDPVMMFKILVIAAMDNLSDERAEFLINDRMSFMRFLGRSLADRVPDTGTIWLYREKLTRAGAIEGLFARFDQALRTFGFIAMWGQKDRDARWTTKFSKLKTKADGSKPPCDIASAMHSQSVPRQPTKCGPQARDQLTAAKSSKPRFDRSVQVRFAFSLGRTLAD